MHNNIITMVKKKSSFSKNKNKTTKKAQKEYAAKAKPCLNENVRKVTKKKSVLSGALICSSHCKSGAALEMEVTEELLAANVLLSLPNGIWWCALQDPDGENDIAVGSCQKWNHILPVYMASGLVNISGEKCDQLTFVQSAFEKPVQYCENHCQT